MEFLYKTAICAGTFDGLHDGHKNFLRFAFSVAEKVLVTITSDSYTAFHKPQASPFTQRKEKLIAFLTNEHLLNRATVLSIDDVYGITLDKSLPLDALVVTEETQKGAIMVNKKRQEIGLPPLAIVTAPYTRGETHLPISSTHLRTGIINEKGEVPLKHELIQATLFLPEQLREKLQKPFGSFVTPGKDIVSGENLIAVGDVTTKLLHNASIYPTISLIDFIVERRKQETTLQDLGFEGTEIVTTAINPPGSLTPSLWQAFEKALGRTKNQEKTVIVVDGEEDLAVLPALLLAPLGWGICYGQPHVGMVFVSVTEATKQQAIHLVDSFHR